jgi:hypothetical protein
MTDTMDPNDEGRANYQKIQEARELLKTAEEEENNRIIAFAKDRDPKVQKDWARAVKFSHIRKNIADIITEWIDEVEFEDPSEPIIYGGKPLQIDTYEFEEFVFDVIRTLFDDNKFEPEKDGVFYPFDGNPHCDVDEKDVVWDAMCLMREGYDE